MTSASDIAWRIGSFNHSADWLFVEAGVSDEFKQLIHPTLFRLQNNELDIAKIGTVRMGGQFRFYRNRNLAEVGFVNTLEISTAAGMEEWGVEFLLAHEYGHLLQNDRAWKRICREKNLDPYLYPLLEAMRDEQIREEYVPAVEEYLKWWHADARRPFLELEAYNTAWEYVDAYMHHLNDGQRYTLIGWLSGRYQEHLAEIADPAKITDLSVLTEEDLAILKLAKKNYQASLLQWHEISNSSHAYRASIQIDSGMERQFEKATAPLIFKNGRDYSLRERLILLRGALNEARQASAILDTMATTHRDRPVTGGLIVDAAERGRERINDLDSLLNRQTAGYRALLAGKNPHRIAYKNDYDHTPDGNFRGQYLAEADFGEDEEIRIGADLGFHFFFAGTKAFVKAAPLLYAGFRPEDTNATFGPRFDLELHYDLDLTQRAGISLLAGASAGAHLGTSEHNAYLEAYGGIEFFLF
ncbi:MAG: hypothetical protein Q7T11_06120 [Deltaproteobacteria bacterium]|nr:hypothetical protein [Deltaproteobacteria bacterium]